MFRIGRTFAVPCACRSRACSRASSSVSSRSVSASAFGPAAFSATASASRAFRATTTRGVVVGPALPSCVMVTVTPNPLYMPVLLAQLDYTGLSEDRTSLLQGLDGEAEGDPCRGGPHEV